MARGGGSFGVKRVTDAVTKSDDAFGRRVADSTRNVLDLASHYNFSPERMRLFRNGSREFVQYNDISQFSDTADSWDLQPDAGDSMHIESAESVTYVVNYEAQCSWAFELNQSLQDGDVLRVGPYNGTDGWVLEQRGADHDSETVDILEYRGGSETTLAEDVELERPLTEWTRLEVRYNWYGVGHQKVKQTYTINGTQFNDDIERTSNDGQRGPQTGNLNLWYGIETSDTTTGLELHCGSCGAVTLGDVTELNRDKPQRVAASVTTADVWEPVYAVRVDPDNANVNANLTVLDIINYGNNAEVELLAVNVDADRTDASGWGPPGYHHAYNSALQSTTNISQVPNTNGTQTTLGADEFVGGYTIGAAVIETGGNTTNTVATRSQQTVEKKNILNSDHTVFLARTSNAGATLRFLWDADQNW